MAELYVNVGGTWKTASNYYVNVNGTWKEGSELHAKVSSAWKESGATAYGGTSGIVSTNIVLDLDIGNSSSYVGSGTTWTDLSGQDNHITLVNSPTYSSSNGGYLSFDGSNDHGTLPAIDLSGNELTFSIWTYSQSQGQASLIFLGDSTAANNGRILNIHLPYGTSYYFDKGFDGSNYDRLTGTLQSSDQLNQWVNWTFTANASTGSMKVYRNGTLYDSATGKTKTFTNANGDLRVIGKNPGTGAHYDGFISQILLYKKELSASEVLQNYNATKGDYLGAISTTNLVLHLDAGKYNSYVGSGTTWTDISGNSNNGTLTNGPTFDSDFGGALVFDGTNDFVQTGSDMFNANADFTFSTWINADTLGTDPPDAFISDNDNTGSLYIRYNLGSGIQVVSNNVGILGTFSSSTLSTNTWYNITITRSTSGSTITYTLYINGSSISTFDSGTTFSHGAQSIGINYSGNAPFDGKIAQVFAYSSALLASEVLANYNATKATFGY